MTLKEELEILRGEPIQVFTGDPMDIPCIETSDPERLCKHPVVSVHMITYNHEPYIREAIEGVMMQKTDFEVELVIGEDCSTDRTREICFEYQKRYPDKIRVLWCDHNLYRNPHPAGGNSQRNIAHCRGEFIAFCEGDDYWIDPLKLQKQHQLAVSSKCRVVVAFNKRRYNDGTYDENLYENKRILTIRDIAAHYFHTTTYLIHRSLFEEVRAGYPRIGPLYDVTLLFCACSVTTIALLPEIVSVYRLTNEGISSSLSKLQRCALMFRQYSALFEYGPCNVRWYCAQSIMYVIRIIMLSGEQEMLCYRKSHIRTLLTVYLKLHRYVRADTITATLRGDCQLVWHLFTKNLHRR